MKFITVVFLALIGFGFAIPVREEGTKPIKTETKEKLRQDEEDGVGEIEQVGEQVSQIINGVLTGNLGQIFGGSTGFISETDTQVGVDNILVGVSNPLNTIIAQAVKQGQQYYNITTAPPPTQFPPTPQPVLVVANPVAVTQPQQPNGLPLNPIVIQPQQLAPAHLKAQSVPIPDAVPVATPVQQVPAAVVAEPHENPEVTSGHGEDEDDDSESEAKLRKQ